MRALLAAFPDEALEAHAELPVMVAGARVYEGANDAATAHLEDADRLTPAVPDERRPAFDLLRATIALWLASRHGDLAAATEAARAVEAAANAQTGSGIARRDQHRAAALLNLGTTELWTRQLADSRRHLEHAVALSRRIGQPYLEVAALAFLAVLATMDEGPVGAARTLADDAVAIVGEHGWNLDPIGAPAFIASAGTLVWSGRFEEGEHEVERARRAVPPAGEPNTEMILGWALGLLRLAQRRPQDALAAFADAERLQERLAEPHPFTADVRSRILRTRVQLGEADAVRADVAELDEATRSEAGMRIAAASAELAEDRHEAALEQLAPVLEGVSHALHPRRAFIEALLHAALAYDALGDRRAVRDAVESALEIAEPEGLVLPFVIVPVHGLLEGHRGHSTAHATLLSDILDVLAGTAPRSARDVAPLREELSAAELRVARYLPTNLTAPQIASELIVSPNTVGTHLRTSTPSSTCTAAAKPSHGRASWGCSPRRCACAEQVTLFR